MGFKISLNIFIVIVEKDSAKHSACNVSTINHTMKLASRHQLHDSR